jgi:hypothetical protein
LDTLKELVSGNLKRGFTDAFEIYGMAGPLNALGRGYQAITGEEFEKIERSAAEQFFKMIE